METLMISKSTPGKPALGVSTKINIPATNTPSAKTKKMLNTPSSKCKINYSITNNNPVTSIDIATMPTTPSSISQSSLSARESAKQSKMINTEERIKKTVELKKKWADDKENKISAFNEKRKADLIRQKAISTATQDARKKNMEILISIKNKTREEQIKMTHDAVEEKKALVDDLLQMEKQRRRQSIMINKEIVMKG